MDDTAKRIQDAIAIRFQNAINEQVDAARQFEVEEGLGTIADAGDQLHGMQQVDHVSAAVEAAVGEAMSGMAVAGQIAFVEAVRLAVMAHPRVQAAIKIVEAIATEVTPQEIDRLRRR